MARLGNFLYGTTLYGYAPVELTNLWALEIDWTDVGFSGSNEADRMIGCSVTRGRSYLLNQDSNGFQRVRPGRMTAVLDNSDGRYDPYNTESELYGLILPGKKFRLRVQNGTNGTLWDVITGYLEDIQPISGRDQVRITGVDRLESLDSILVQHADIETSVRVDDTIEYILQDAGLTASEYAVDQISDTIPYWWMDNITATYAIGELEDLVIGTFFIGADGIARFYSRRRLNEPTIQIIESDDILREIAVNQPWELIRNQVEIPVSPRTQQAASTLFSITDPIAVTSGETLTMWAAYTYNDEQVPALSVSVTQPSSDYKVYQNSNGTGTDLTANFTLAVTTFNESAKLVITGYGGTNGYITALNVKGNALTSPNPSIIRGEDATSIATYGNRKLVIDSKWQQSTNDAVDRKNIVLTVFADIRRNLVIQMESRSDIQFELDLFDRVSVMIPTLQIDSAYRVGGIEHEWLNDNGQSVLTTLTLEEMVDYASSYWTFPTNIGQTSYLA